MRRREGGLSLHALRLLAVLAAVIVVWVWWKGDRGGSSPPPAAQTVAAPGTNGALIIPTIDKTGRPGEPLVLVPVDGPIPLNQTPAPLPPTNRAARTQPGLVPAGRTNAAPPAFAELPNFDERVLAAQVALARHGISSGSFDGLLGGQTSAALRAFQRREGLPLTGSLDDATRALLQTDAPPYTNYVVTVEDLGRLLPLGTTWLAKSQQERMDFETILELVAERTHSNPKLVRALNPAVNWAGVTNGTSLRVIATGSPEPERKAAWLRIAVSGRTLQAFDAETNLLAHFPCSIAARVEKRPVGEELHVSVVAPNPNYTFDPEVFPESAEARQLGRKLILQPGPNNPVGVAWLGLDKPGYGMHGTPRPEDVGRTESHGCFRLANWNAELLLKLVTIGTPVFVDP